MPILSFIFCVKCGETYDDEKRKICTGTCNHSICEQCFNKKLSTNCPVCEKMNSFEEKNINWPVIQIMNEVKNTRSLLKTLDIKFDFKTLLRGSCSECNDDCDKLSICADCSKQTDLLMKSKDGHLEMSTSGELLPKILRIESTAVCSNCMLAGEHHGHNRIFIKDIRMLAETFGCLKLFTLIALAVSNIETASENFKNHLRFYNMFSQCIEYFKKWHQHYEEAQEIDTRLGESPPLVKLILETGKLYDEFFAHFAEEFLQSFLKKIEETNNSEEKMERQKTSQKLEKMPEHLNSQTPPIGINSSNILLLCGIIVESLVERVTVALIILKDAAVSIISQQATENDNVLKCQEIAKEILKEIPAIEKSLNQFNGSLDGDPIEDSCKLFQKLNENSDSLFNLVNSLPSITKSHSTINTIIDITRALLSNLSTKDDSGCSTSSRLEKDNSQHLKKAEERTIALAERRIIQDHGNCLSFYKMFFEKVVNTGKRQFQEIVMSKREEELNDEYGHVLFHFMKVEGDVLNFRIKTFCDVLENNGHSLKIQKRKRTPPKERRNSTKAISFHKANLINTLMQIKANFDELKARFDIEENIPSDPEIDNCLIVLTFLIFSFRNSNNELLQCGSDAYNLQEDFLDLHNLGIVEWILNVVTFSKEHGSLPENVSLSMQNYQDQFNKFVSQESDSSGEESDDDDDSSS